MSGWKRRINSGQKKKKVSFHRFPKDPIARNRWLQILNLDASLISVRAYLCSDHFKEEDFNKRCANATLLPNSLPKGIEKERETDILSVSNEKTVERETDLSDDNVCKMQEEENAPRPRTPEQNNTSLLITYCSTAVPSTSTADKTTMMSPTKIFNSPEKCRLRKRIAYLKKNYRNKIRSLQQNVRRKTCEVATLKSVLNHIKEKNMLNNEQADVLQTLEKPGISLEALNAIKQRVDNTEYPLLGCLIFDEMAIRQHVEFDGIKFSGYTDLGDDIACDDNTLASEALVFMIVCINSGWKIPIAYFLINKMNAEQKSNLALQCISAVHNVGMRVMWFPHPETKEKIFAFLDPCHMLKL
ncbi:thap domain-containing, partial [Lasius niger]